MNTALLLAALIFSDGFETGSTARWSRTVGAAPQASPYAGPCRVVTIPADKLPLFNDPRLYLQQRAYVRAEACPAWLAGDRRPVQFRRGRRVSVAVFDSETGRSCQP